MTKSLTTLEMFRPMIEHLPFTVFDVQSPVLRLVPQCPRDQESDLFRALEIAANKRGLKARKGIAVWTVKGFATDAERKAALDAERWADLERIANLKSDRCPHCSFVRSDESE